MKRQSRAVARETKTETKAETNKALANFFGGGTIANVQSLQSTMAKLGGLSRNTGGGLYLRFTKAGEWLFGSDLEEVGADERFAVNPLSFVNGWIGWQNGSVVGEHMCPVAEGMPCSEADLDPIRSSGASDGWSAQLGVTMVSIDEEDPLELIYKATSRGGKQAISGLADEISARMRMDEVSFVPIVMLDADSYKHKSYGTINTPVLRVVAWADMSGNIVEEVEAAA